jgi:hypothetical protein
VPPRVGHERRLVLATIAVTEFISLDGVVEDPG